MIYTYIYVQQMIWRVVGNGVSVSFWHEAWVSPIPLASMHNRLYSIYISLSKHATVVQMGEWRDGSWIWKLPWRRNLFIWEQELDGNNNWENRCSWQHHSDGFFTVKSAAYLTITEVEGQQVLIPYKLLWDRAINPS